MHSKLMGHYVKASTELKTKLDRESCNGMG